jgi:hypothetical protein
MSRGVFLAISISGYAAGIILTPTWITDPPFADPGRSVNDLSV